MLGTRPSAGILPAFAGILCLVIVALEPSVGRADELADLRASQELLQRRLDQLALVPSAGGLYPGEPRSSLAGAGGGSFPRSFLIPGTDTSLRISGDLRVNVTYIMTGASPNAFPTSNVGSGGALNVAPLHIHNAAPVAGVFPPAGNPARSRGTSITFITPQQSRITTETRTPTAWGEASTSVTFDLSNGNTFVPGNNALLSTSAIIPRVLNVYATLGGFLGGQANSNFRDADAEFFTLEYGGLVGGGGINRVPQIRYTQPLAAWSIPGALSIAAEAPETEGFVPGAGLIASDATCTIAGLAGCATAGAFNPFKAPVPDVTAAWYIPQPWGHLDFSTVVRPKLQIKDGTFVDRTFTGYGVHFSGDVKPRWFGWAKDYLVWSFVWGDGLGRYLNNTSEFALVTNYPSAAPPTSAAAAADVIVKTTIGWGSNVGYEHWFTDSVRARIGAGIVHHDINTGLWTTAGGAAGTVTRVSAVCPSPGIPAGAVGAGAALSGTGGCGLNKELMNANVNVVWSPVSFVDLGLGYMWGHRVVVSNLKGDVNALFTRMRITF
jgi:hypothetical protein